MSDYSEFKRLAEAACGEDWSGAKAHEFMAHANPAAVLALIAENEQLRDGSNMRAIRSLRGDCADLATERDQLKAESEVLRKNDERYRWLRDPDNQEDIEPDSDYLMPPIICGYAEHEDILSMEALDKAIDASMGSGEQP